MCSQICSGVVPVLFGVLEVLLVVSRFEEVALNDADDPDTCPLARGL